jgi:cation diffusion facilitator CzcD-associated flavoprotein CzcO
MIPSAEVVVIGAGPHGLAATLHLLQADPALRGHLVVADPAGDWMAGWRSAFARLDIGTLRSPGVHHPAPDPSALETFTHHHGLARSGLPYGIPVAATFDAFCRHLVTSAGLDGAVRRARVARIEPAERQLLVRFGDGGGVHARRVVVAADPHRRVLPDWLPRVLPLPPDRLAHAADVDLRDRSFAGETVVVVGGGLTAAHLAVGAAARGARVELLARSLLRERTFDVDPGWLGPRELDAYHREPDPARRLALARRARSGGSIPGWMLERLDPLVRAGTLTVRAAEVTDAKSAPGGLVLQLSDGGSVAPDRIWLATGTAPSLGAARMLEPLLPDVPTVDDHPALGPDLRLGPWPVHVTGRLATATLGPAAGNLWGARMAARAITS